MKFTKLILAMLATLAVGYKVVVIGGGPSGMSAAHDLRRANVDVEIHEASSRFGGKMISSRKKVGSDPVGYPTEHAPRVYMKSYLALFDLFDQIPSGKGTVLDNIVTLDEVCYTNTLPSRYCVTPIENETTKNTQTSTMLAAQGATIGDLQWFAQAYGAYQAANLTARFQMAGEVTFFEFMCECKTIKCFADHSSLCTGDQESAFVREPDKQTPEHRNPTCDYGSHTCELRGKPFITAMAAMVGSIVAARLDSSAYSCLQVFDIKSSVAHTPAHEFLAPALVANGPTAEVAVEPWVKHLENMGANLVTDSRLTHFNYSQDRATAAVFVDETGKESVVNADAFILAVPAKAANQLMPQLGLKVQDATHWSFSIQFYLPSIPTALQERSVGTQSTVVIDHPWFLATMIYQPGQHWSKDAKLPDGIAAVLTVAVSDVTTRGPLTDKTFLECTKEEAMKEILTGYGYPTAEQAGIIETALLGDYLSYVDQADSPSTESDVDLGPVQANNRRWVLRSPLFAPTPDIPPASPLTTYQNLVLAGEWVAAPIFIVPTMEHAAESGKIAAQLTLDQAQLKHNVPAVDILLASTGYATAGEYATATATGPVLSSRVGVCLKDGYLCGAPLPKRLSDIVNTSASSSSSITSACAFVFCYLLFQNL